MDDALRALESSLPTCRLEVPDELGWDCDARFIGRITDDAMNRLLPVCENGPLEGPLLSFC